jgi:hypothetical protein
MKKIWAVRKLEDLNWLKKANPKSITIMDEMIHIAQQEYPN